MAFWGEVELPPKSPLKLSLPDPKPAEFSIPKLRKLSARTQSDSNQPLVDPSIQFPVSSKGRNIHLHNVDQINHVRRMQQLIAQAQTQVQFLKADPSSDEFEFPKCPSPPSRFYSERLAPVPNYSMPAVFSAAQRHKRIPTRRYPITILDRHRTHQLTRRAIELSIAHCGFNSASDFAIEILTDVLGDHLRKLCCLLRSARDDEGLYGSCGFRDCVERMLHGVGVTGIEELQKHWLSSIWEYGVRLQETADSMHKEYGELQAAWQKHKPGYRTEQETTTMQETQLEDCKVSSLKIPVICEFQTWYLPADGEFCLSIDYMHPY
jgi:hypothetical protein